MILAGFSRKERQEGKARKEGLYAQKPIMYVAQLLSGILSPACHSEGGGIYYNLIRIRK
jgi:hypothetical protein